MQGSAIDRWLPGVRTAREYRRAWLWPDLRAGAVVTALLIPAGMGYAQVSGLPPEAGLYATVVPLAVYALVGPSRILVLGPDSALAPVIAAAILPLARGDEDRALALAGLLALMVGTLMLVGGLLRLGFVTDLLSKPVRLGFLNAIALVVIVSQLPALLGLAVEAESFAGRAAAVARGIAAGEVAPIPAAVGLTSLAVILVMRRWRAPIPGVLVAVMLATLATWLLDLAQTVPVVGALPHGLPAPALAGLTWGDVAAVAAPAAGIALVAFTDSAVLSRSLAARRGESVSGSAELTGIGMANIASGALGGFPISASSSRTPVAEQAGSRTQLTGLVGAALIVVFILAVPGVTAFLPAAALAAVVTAAVLSLIDLPGLAALWRMNRLDALLSLAASAGVLVAGVLRGILVAIVLSLVAFIRRSWRPYRAELGRVPGLRGYHDLSRYPEAAASLPGMVLLRFDAPLFFANGGVFNTWVRERVDARGPGVRTVVLAAEPITGIDTTAVEELVELDDYLQARGIRLVFAEMKDPVVDQLRRYGLGARFTPDRFAPTVGAAVDDLTGHLRGDLEGTRWDGDDADEGRGRPRQP